MATFTYWCIATEPCSRSTPSMDRTSGRSFREIDTRYGLHDLCDTSVGLIISLALPSTPLHISHPVCVTHAHRPTQVFANYDLENPIASCFLYQSLPTEKPAFILEFAGEPFRDDVVVSYIVQRHRLRMEDKAVDLFVGLR